MSDFKGILGMQVSALVEALRSQQESQCRKLIGEAELRARNLLRDSRRQLAERGRQAVHEERRRREAALKMARHRIQTAERVKVQTRYADLLQHAWPALIAELERRWSAAALRRAWCEKLVDEAVHAFGAAAWTIEHPDDWSAADAKWMTAALRKRGVPKPNYRAESNSGAGLKISHGSACLDGTVEGLLRRRSRIEGLLLAAWERQGWEPHE